jgi:DinB superfamily
MKIFIKKSVNLFQDNTVKNAKNNMNPQLENIINNLSETYNGMPWHGNSLKELLREIDVKMAFYRPFEKKHNIAELVAHILIWRQYALEILLENYNAHIDIGSLADFPTLDESEKIWRELLTQLDKNQVVLLENLKAFSASKLEDEIPEKPFTFRYLFEGIVYHDVYHGGQIGLIKAAYLSNYVLNEDVSKKVSFI